MNTQRMGRSSLFVRVYNSEHFKQVSFIFCIGDTNIEVDFILSCALGKSKLSRFSKSGLRTRHNAGHSVKLYSVYRPHHYFQHVFIEQSPSLEENDNLSP